MTTATLAIALLTTSASPAAAQWAEPLVRGEMPVSVWVRGSIVAADVVRVKAAFEGRVEEVQTSTYTWSLADRPLAYLASHEMVAMLDSKTTTIKETLAQRWEGVYQLQKIICREDCFVLRAFAKNGQWLKPRTLMYEVTSHLQLVARVRPEDAHWIKNGHLVEFWPVKQPKNKMRSRVQRYVLDITKAGSGGAFAADLTPDSYLPPGTEWEGRVIPLTRRRALIAPTDALIQYKGSVYLPVRVTTGVTTADLTEIMSGVDTPGQVLILDDARLKKAERYRQGVDESALDQRLKEQEAESANAPPSSFDPATSPRQAPAFLTSPRQRAGALPDPDATFSETPTGQ